MLLSNCYSWCCRYHQYVIRPFTTSINSLPRSRCIGQPHRIAKLFKHRLLFPCQNVPCILSLFTESPKNRVQIYQARHKASPCSVPISSWRGSATALTRSFNTSKTGTIKWTNSLGDDDLHLQISHMCLKHVRATAAVPPSHTSRVVCRIDNPPIRIFSWPIGFSTLFAQLQRFLPCFSLSICKRLVWGFLCWILIVVVSLLQSWPWHPSNAMMKFSIEANCARVGGASYYSKNERTLDWVSYCARLGSARISERLRNLWRTSDWFLYRCTDFGFYLPGRLPHHLQKFFHQFICILDTSPTSSFIFLASLNKKIRSFKNDIKKQTNLKQQSCLWRSCWWNSSCALLVAHHHVFCK